MRVAEHLDERVLAPLKGGDLGVDGSRDGARSSGHLDDVLGQTELERERSSERRLAGVAAREGVIGGGGSGGRCLCGSVVGACPGCSSSGCGGCGRAPRRRQHAQRVDEEGEGAPKHGRALLCRAPHGCEPARAPLRAPGEEVRRRLGVGGPARAHVGAIFDATGTNASPSELRVMASQWLCWAEYQLRHNIARSWRVVLRLPVGECPAAPSRAPRRAP
jgi:hypothetical protein